MIGSRLSEQYPKPNKDRWFVADTLHLDDSEVRSALLVAAGRVRATGPLSFAIIDSEPGSCRAVRKLYPGTSRQPRRSVERASPGVVLRQRNRFALQRGGMDGKAPSLRCLLKTVSQRQ